MDNHTRTLSLPGTSLAYHVQRPAAAETPVVFLHPWFGCWQFWISTMQHLTERPCYAVDLYSPANGEWQDLAGPVGLAEAVLAMMDAEKLEQIDLVGNSVGGIVAQVIASRAPGHIRRLALVGTGASTVGALPGFAGAVDRWIESAHQGGAAARTAVEDTVDMLFNGRPDHTTWDTYVQAVLRTNPAYLAAVLSAARELDLTPQLRSITADTLVLRGSDDCARTSKHAAALAAGIPNAHSVEMPGAGHSPMIDHPDEFAHIITAHLDGHAPAPSGQS